MVKPRKKRSLRFESLSDRNMMAGFNWRDYVPNYSVPAAPSATTSKPTISISSTEVTEGDKATLTVSLSKAFTKTVSVRYTVSYDTAGSGDVTKTSGTLYFKPGETSKQLTVSTKEDTQVENQEQFKVVLSSPSNATLGVKTGIVKINDDDTVTPPPPPPTDPPPVPTGNFGPRTVSQPSDAKAITSISNLPSDMVLYLRAGTYSGTLSLRTGQRLVAEYGTTLNLSGVLNIPQNASVENLIINGGRPSSEWESSVVLGNGAKLLNSEQRNGYYAGVSVGSNAVLQGNYIHDNRRTGIIANFASNGKIIGNDVYRNNPTKAFDPYDEAGGSKLWETQGFEVAYNRFRDNIGNGLWFDYRNSGAWIHHNETSGNTLAGIFWEISFDCIIEYNKSFGDGKGYSLSGWLNGAAIVIEDSYGTSSKQIIVRFNESTDSTNGIGIINQGDREDDNGNPFYTRYISVTDSKLNNSGKSGYVGDAGKPGNLTWLRNTLSGNSRIVGSL